MSSEEAGELHVRLCDGDASEVLPHSGIAAFYAELTAQAAKHGLAFYDPQSERVVYPGQSDAPKPWWKRW